MIVRQFQQVLDGTKTQTRRCLQAGEFFAVRYGLRRQIIDRPAMMKRHDGVWDVLGLPIIEVFTPSGRLKHALGRSYAIVPKRASKSVGRIEMKQIRLQMLQDITEADAIAEGVASVSEYQELWQSINGRVKGRRWEDNPWVWVYTFALVQSEPLPHLVYLDLGGLYA